MMPDPRRKLRVLCVDYSVGFGGATKSMSLMLRQLGESVIPFVVTSQSPDIRRLWYGSWRTYGFRRRCNYSARWTLEAKLERKSIPAWVRASIGKGYALVDALTGLASACQIAFLARWHKVDLLHLANGFMPPEVFLAGKLARVPTIAHLRGFYERGASGRLAWAPPALVIGDSEAVRRSFVDAEGSRVPSTTLYEVVDVAAVAAAEGRRASERRGLGVSRDDVVVGLFGRVVPWKGQKEFVHAMTSAMKRDPKLIAVVVGDGSDGGEGYERAVKDLIEDSGLRDRFRLTGYVEEVEPLYHAMDVIVHASIEPEPCGMVVMEGMAAGKPVVASDAGGPRELLRDGVDGYLVPPADPDAMAAAILRLGADPDLRASMGAAGRARALERFDTPVIAGQLRRLYRTLVHGERSASTVGSGRPEPVRSRPVVTPRPASRALP